jgi:hypothetical protein
VLTSSPEEAKSLVRARPTELGFVVLDDGDGVADITGLEGLDESIEAAVERMHESGAVEFGDFETFPLDDLEGHIGSVAPPE